MELRRGFTLIELLVVISIISLLSSVVLAALNDARAKASIGAGLQFESGAYRAAADYAVGIWDFDECSGVAVDRSGNGNTGTLIGGATFSSDTPTGKGCSMLLDGGDDYVSVADSSSMTFTGDITMTAWIKPSVIGGGNYRTFIAKRGGTGTNYEMFLHNNSGAVSWYNGTQYNSSYTPTLNQWVHVAGVISGTRLTIYVNGRSVSTYTIAPVSALTGNPFTIGRAGTVGEFFGGRIDSVRVFSKSLTAAEVGHIYAEEAGQTLLTDAVQ